MDRPITQSSLGTFEAVEKNPGQNIDRILLGEVTAVHLKYGTVDFKIYEDSSNYVASNRSGGKFSARIPREFSGTTKEGKPYGSVLPIQAGTLVLVGFVGGSKSTPIILSVYSTATEAEMLNRSSVETVYGKDELAKDTGNRFVVYPNLTYDSIEGDGTRNVSFTGKSFISIDSKSDANMSGLFDDHIGTPYEALPSSYYATGELIEPSNGRKPAILFSQNGEDPSGDDSNKFLWFLDEEGTHRVSTLNSEEEWRSYLEITKDGNIQLRRQNDSTTPGQGSDNNYLIIGKDEITIRVGDKFWNFTRDGISSNGGGIGGGGGAGGEIFATPEQLKALGDELGQNIISMRTYLEQDFQKIIAGAEKVFTDLEDKYVEQQAELKIMSDAITTKVDELQLKGAVDDSMKEYVEALNDLSENAMEQLKALAELAEDNVLSPMEKKSLATIWSGIRAEYLNYVYQAQESELNADAYSSAYTKLKNYVEPLLEDMSNPTDIDRVVFTNNFTNYYTERSNIVYAIFEYLTESIRKLARQFTENAVNMNDAFASMAGVNGDLISVINLLNDIGSDNVLTPREQRDLASHYDKITSSYLLLKQRLAVDYDEDEENMVDTSALDSAYETLMNYLTSVGVKPTTSTNVSINNEQMKEEFRQYFAKLIDYTQDISMQAIEKLRTYQGDLEWYNTSITQNKKSIELMANSVVAQGEDVRINTARLYVMADRIGTSVTKTTLKREINEAMNILNKLGRNLLIQKGSLRGNVENGVFTANSNGQFKGFTKIPVEPAEIYTISVAEDPIDVTYTFLDANGNVINTTSQEVAKDTPITLVTPNMMSGGKEARFITIAVPFEDGFTKVKLEKGSNATTFAFAPEDALGNIEVAREEERTREIAHQLAEAKKNYGLGDTDKLLGALAIYTEDYTLTPAEKTAIKEFKEAYEKEYQEMITYGNQNNLNTLNYQGAYQALIAVMEESLLDPDKSSAVFPNTLISSAKSYTSARQTILDQAESITKEALRVTKESIAEMSSSALESQRLAQILAQDAEQQALNTKEAYNAYLLSEEDGKAKNNSVGSIVKDSILGIDEKVTLEGYLQEIKAEQDELHIKANVYGLSTLDLENTLNTLDSTLSKYLTPEALREAETPIDKSTIASIFSGYYTSRSALLNSIYTQSKLSYEELNRQATDAYNEASLRSEEIAVLQNAITDSKLILDEVNKKIEDLRSERNYMVTLTSTNGTLFKNSIIETQLQAKLYFGEKDVTYQLANEDFKWTKINQDGTEDKLWNTIHENIGGTITVNHTDVEGRATFRVAIYTDDKPIVLEG